MTTHRLCIFAEVDELNGITIGDAAQAIIEAMTELKKQGYSGKDLREIEPSQGVIKDNDGEVVGDWHFEAI